MKIYDITLFKNNTSSPSDFYGQELSTQLNTLNKLLNLSNLKTKKFDKKSYSKKTVINIDNLSEIKKCLNKITLETYNDNKKLLIDLFNNYEDHTLGADTIYNILSSNSFFTDLYTKLYIELIEEFDVFRKTLILRKELSFSNYENIISVKLDENYDQFCKNNRKNDIIKSQIKFNSMLFLKTELNDDYIIKILNFLLNKIKTEENDVIIFEYIENINIIITTCYEKLKNISEWHDMFIVLNKIIDRSDEYKHIKNKAVFKIMDIIDFINN